MMKPRVRVKAGTTFAPNPGTVRTVDSFVNFAAKLGVGAGNLSDASGYDFNFISHQRTGLEAAYRGSWIIGAAVDHAADDMTTQGIEIEGDLSPDKSEKLIAGMRDLQVFQSLSNAIRWGRLYGGAIAMPMIDGQDPAQPLKLDSVKEGQFKGLLVLDRWMVQPSMGELISDLGPDIGLPKFYRITQNTEVNTGPQIHHSRAPRFIGAELPYQQSLVENRWGMSVIERIFDRVIAFDSTTQGAAQLVFKAYLRTWKIKDLRNLIAEGGPYLEAITKNAEMIRLFQSNEGLTMLDMDDEMETATYAFTGLDDILLQFGQQLAGAIEEPMVRLFGQSPAGLNSTGESDLRTYYDNIHKKQERDLRRSVTLILDICSRSILGHGLPEGFSFKFAPLWQTPAEEKPAMAQQRTSAVTDAFDKGIVTRATALKELKQGAREDGVWSNIGDDEIKEAEEDPTPGDLAKQAMEQTQKDIDTPAPDPNAKVTPMKAA